MAHAHGLPDETPVVEYPCDWAYKVIGRDVDALRAAVDAVIGLTRCTVKVGRTSRAGAYVTVRVDCVVESEAERNGWFLALKAHADTVLVL